MNNNRPDNQPPLINAMSVDVEDYFHVSAFAEAIDPASWDDYECRVERNTDKLLATFADRDVKATFFVLGWVAERYPELIRRIAAGGHEIACHGYSHQLIYNQSRERFRDETFRSKALLEDIVQQPVIGYRAASFSINKDSEWALDTLAEAGFRYDSSIFPVRHDRYGVSDAPRFPYTLKTPSGAELAEYPMTTARVLGANMPVSGGGYFRLYPYWLTRMALSRVLDTERRPFMFYLHPWEIDPGQPRIAAKWFSRFRHYNNLDRCHRRLERLLGDFHFGTVEASLRQAELLS
jgi:polysaccharide deacetylase family protein (PEP-CTERM system associated)